jgi:hypothetical protein
MCMTFIIYVRCRYERGACLKPIVIRAIYSVDLSLVSSLVPIKSSVRPDEHRNPTYYLG